MPDPYLPRLTAELRAHGVQRWRVERGGKHPRLVFAWQGREIAWVFPSSPSDSGRGLMNAVAGLRRLMGVRRVQAGRSGWDAGKLSRAR